MTASKGYEVTEERFIGGQHRKVGEPVQMTERAAKYYVPPYGTGLKLAAPLRVQTATQAETKPAEKVAKAEG